MKLLVWALLGLLVYWALRSQAKRNREKFKAKSGQDTMRSGSAQPPPKSATSAEKPIENMVACSYCQIYLPASEAIHLVTAASEHYFCSEEHARLHSNADANPDTNVSAE